MTETVVSRKFACIRSLKDTLKPQIQLLSKLRHTLFCTFLCRPYTTTIMWVTNSIIFAHLGSACFDLPGCQKLQNYRFKQGMNKTNSLRGLYDKKGTQAQYCTCTYFPQTDKKYIFERLHKPLNRQKTVNRKTHKTAINRPVDHAGET